MKPAAVHHTKALLSRQYDECDLKYEKRATRRGRQACFWGTTNEHAYLFDETGNRRIWPLRCGVTCDMADLEGLAKVRDQLWAEAALYEATGETIHATEADMKEELASVTDLRQVHDEWEPKIREKLIEVKNACEANSHPVRTTISDVREALSILLHEFDKGKQDRVRSGMRAVGWSLYSTSKHRKNRC
jgi:predicted P-loop ATPase